MVCRCLLLPASSLAARDKARWWRSQKSGNNSPGGLRLVGYPIYRGFIQTSQKGCLGFLNHQQYHDNYKWPCQSSTFGDFSDHFLGFWHLSSKRAFRIATHFIMFFLKYELDINAYIYICLGLGIYIHIERENLIWMIKLGQTYKNTSWTTSKLLSFHSEPENMWAFNNTEEGPPTKITGTNLDPLGVGSNQSKDQGVEELID